MKVPETMNYQIEQDPKTGSWAVFSIESGEKVSDDFDTRFDAMKDMKQRMADEDLEKKNPKKDESKDGDDAEKE